MPILAVSLLATGLSPRQALAVKPGQPPFTQTVQKSLEETALSKAYTRYSKMDLYNYGMRFFLDAKGEPVEIDNLSIFRLTFIKVVKPLLLGEKKAAFEVAVGFIINEKPVYANGLMNEKGEVDVLQMHFLTENPKTKNYSIRNWEGIYKGSVSRGMNVLELTLAWGTPLAKKKEKTRKAAFEEWTYANMIVILRDGIVISVDGF